MSIFDVIQWVCGGHRSWRIRLPALGTDAAVTVVDGDLTDARWGDKVGQDALLEILKVDRGCFELEPIVGESPRTLEGNSTWNLLSAAQAASASKGAPALPQANRTASGMASRGSPAPPGDPLDGVVSQPPAPAGDAPPSPDLPSSDPSEWDEIAVPELIDRGFAAVRSGAIEKAKAIWRQALKRDPGNRALQFNLRKLDGWGSPP